MISSIQSAYRPAHSCETALVRIQDDILHSLDNRNTVILVLLDLSTAFDTVDHRLLLDKLHGIGIRDNAHRWIQSYLSQRTQAVKVVNIGFVSDDTMSMAAQIRRVCQVAYCHIPTIRKCLSTTACKTIIHALVMSRLDYGNAMLYGLPETQLRKLQMIQNSAARLITGTRRRDHITPVLFSLHWLPVRQRIEFKLILLVFRDVHHLCPVYLSSLMIPYTPTRTLRSADQYLLTIPRYHLERYGRRAVSVARPTLWNF